ncbi:hypothetical protein IE53DRAFT_388598 [Violaceomyces palustris]|uniref:Uncharacterized protein n=1 Tax=Violaceomyces palustris TaxID=1673888 RepID=A0ACD0NTU3_9BASI|nr:hypothetical protein IE53DRAFT_388598 [Violaceomyces palustris]
MSAPDPKGLIAARFLESLLSDIVLDTALIVHSNVKKARSICPSCGFRCRIHTSSANHTHPSAKGFHQNEFSYMERGGSTRPSSVTPAPPNSTPMGNTGSVSAKPDYYSHNPLFECLVCSRQVSSNRYATHLAKCMGMGGKGSRKGAARNAKSSNALAAAAAAALGRFGSSGINTGNASNASNASTPKDSSDIDGDEVTSSKKKKTVSTSVGPKSNGKRALSPLSASNVAQARMNKKLKTSTPPPLGSGSRLDPDLASGMSRSHSAQTFAPSSLGTAAPLTGSPLNPRKKGGDGAGGLGEKSSGPFGGDGSRAPSADSEGLRKDPRRVGSSSPTKHEPGPSRNGQSIVVAKSRGRGRPKGSGAPANLVGPQHNITKLKDSTSRPTDGSKADATVGPLSVKVSAGGRREKLGGSLTGKKPGGEDDDDPSGYEDPSEDDSDDEGSEEEEDDDESGDGSDDDEGSDSESSEDEEDDNDEETNIDVGTHQDDDEEDDEEGDDDEEEDDEDEEHEEGSINDDASSADLPLGATSATIPSPSAKKANQGSNLKTKIIVKTSSSSNGGGLQRGKGSDGEFIDVESASEAEQSDDGLF